MSVAMPSVPIGKLTERVISWNPPRDAPDEELDYIDLGSVDNAVKEITANPYHPSISLDFTESCVIQGVSMDFGGSGGNVVRVDCGD